MTDTDATTTPQPTDPLHRQDDESHALRHSSKRFGDKLYKGLATGSGTLILIILAAVATFLIGLSLPALTADAAELQYGEFWSYALPFAFGTVWAAALAMVFAVPVAIGIALFIVLYAPRPLATTLAFITDLLAAVPSIIFGLLGLAVFLNTMNMPRSAPIVGGLTLALMTLPVIVIASRAAIKAVPPSIRDAALGIGASPVQVVFHHVLPLALPGMLTGTILGMARALGETAPLLMIGMRAFLTSVPQGFTQPATALPVQIFIWSDNVSRGFVEKTSGAIIVLLLFLLMINSLAIYLRNRFEVRW